MKVILARNAGFCMGVRRAVDTTLNMVTVEKGGIATYGPLIHNPQVLDLLEGRGVEVLQDVPEQHTGTVIIRAHGVPPQKKEQLQKSGAKVKDATCPRVVKVQVIIDKYRKKGCQTVIIGDLNHAEVDGLMGHAGPTVQVVSSERDIDGLQLPGPYIIVSQTTQDERAFDKLSKEIVERFPGGRIFNTICDSTHKRQEEVRRLAGEVEAMVVVGGKTSANTTRLGEIARSMGRPVFMVESENDLNLQELRKYRVIGVTAGASTPTWLINLVVRVLESVPTVHDGVLKPFLFKVLWLILATNVYVSLAAASLTYACMRLLDMPFDWRPPLLTAGYILAMHNLNRFNELHAKKISDPLKAYFFQRQRGVLFFFSTASLLLSLYLAFTLGNVCFLFLLLMSVIGILYSVRFIPRIFKPIFKVRMLREIPASKTLFVSIAWGFITVILPLVSYEKSVLTVPVFWSFLFSLSLAYVRCSLFDVFDMQGDRIVGRETLPVLLGEKRTLAVLYGVLAIDVCLMAMLWEMKILSGVILFFMPAAVLFFLLALLYQKKVLPAGPVFEYVLDGVFVALGAAIWLA